MRLVTSRKRPRMLGRSLHFSYDNDVHGDFSVIAGKGILASALATGILGFITTILFLFCTPDLDTLFSLDAAQPFVQIYAMALGKGPSIFMTIIAIIGLMMVSIPASTNWTDILTLSFPEHQCSDCGCFQAGVRRRTRWCPSIFELDRTSHCRRSAEKCCYSHLLLCRVHFMHHST
jgi:hypothetical protein